jgi:hypothetical protein
MVNAAVVRGPITFPSTSSGEPLFGETCLQSGMVVYGNPDVESTRKRVGCLPVPVNEPMERLSAIEKRNRQVEAGVSKGRSSQMPQGNLRTRRRAEHY